MVTIAHRRLNDHDHPVRLCGAWADAAGRPSLVERKDEDFLTALLNELQAPHPHHMVGRDKPSAVKSVLRLHQPVHRVYSLVLVEAHCETFMTPRLDHAKIESSGFVVRRVVQPKSKNKRELIRTTRQFEGWLNDQGDVLGWKLLGDVNVDPDPARRRRQRLTGDAAVDAELLPAPDLRAEQVTSLFLAPPEVARATGRTVLYGVIPTSSTARAGAPPKGEPANDDEWRQHLSLLLKARPATRPMRPTDLQSNQLELDDLKGEFPSPEAGDFLAKANALRFALLVRQLAQEFQLLHPVNPRSRDELLAALNSLRVDLVDGSTKPLGQYLTAAAAFYFADEDERPPAPARPKTWPVVGDGTANAIFHALKKMAGEVEAAVLAPGNTGGRYDDPAARYVVRAFIRVRCPDGCPPKIVWSEPSEEFTIVPWFEPGPAPPLQIQLPDPFDPAVRKGVGVAFSVPKSLAKVMNQDPLELLKGNAGKTDLKVDWLCGFNIPIITICAFILLNIMLNILNLIFHWLPFVKVCIPFPRVAPPPKP